MEFCRFGLAGARVDRIAAAGSINKRMIYHYFNDKAGLFDAAVGACLGESNRFDRTQSGAALPGAARPGEARPGEARPSEARPDLIEPKELLTEPVVWMLFWAHLERPEALAGDLLVDSAFQSFARPLDYALACMRIAEVLLPGLVASGADLALPVQALGRTAAKPRITLKPRLQAASLKPGSQVASERKT